MEDTKFKVGDRVTWKSSAKGWTTKKVGEVVMVIPRGVLFPERRLMERHNCRSAYGGGFSRAKESYAVLVPHPRKGKPTIYWPWANQLKRP